MTYAPHEAAVARETLENAVLVTVQHLPPRERAGVILRDAAGFSARETPKPLANLRPHSPFTCARRASRATVGSPSGAARGGSNEDEITAKEVR